MDGLAGAQAPHANLMRRGQENDEIEAGDDAVAPAVEPAAQHPIGARQEYLPHQPQPVGGSAQRAIGRRGRLPEIVVRVVMRQRQGIGQRTSKRRDTGSRCARHVNAATLHAKIIRSCFIAELAASIRVCARTAKSRLAAKSAKKIYRFLFTGLRFSMKAAIPSARSSSAKV